MKAHVREHGYVTTLFGRKIHFPQVKSGNPAERAFVDRASINAPIQGTAADVIRRAMIRMEPALAKAKLSAKMLLQVHDELVFEAPEEEVDGGHAGDRRRHGEGGRAGDLADRPSAGRRRRRRQLGRGALGRPSLDRSSVIPANAGIRSITRPGQKV